MAAQRLPHLQSLLRDALDVERLFPRKLMFDCERDGIDREKAELASDSLDNQPIGGYTDAVDELLGESMIEMERRTR